MKTLFSEIVARSINKSKFLYSYFSSAIMGFLCQREYKNIITFCLFIGYGRSGHTLIASLLDAHPDVIIGIEWGLFDHVRLGFKKKQIFYSLIKNSQNYTKKKNNTWTGYSYKVDVSWQGKYRLLRVIGDKHGGTNSTKLYTNPELLEKTEKIVNIKPKLIHVIRNPFDIITTIMFRKLEEINPNYIPNSFNLLPFIDKFFQNASVLKDLKEKKHYDIFDIYHEEFIKEPKDNLKNLLSFLGIEADNDYLDKCASIVYTKPNKSRYRIKWPGELINLVENELVNYPFLKKYKYSD